MTHQNPNLHKKTAEMGGLIIFVYLASLIFAPMLVSLLSDWLVIE